MISEIFRTYVAGFLSPTSFLGLFLILGLILLWTRKNRIVITAAVVCFFVFTTAPLRFSLFSFTEPEAETIPAVYKYVVVLGGKIFANEKHPASSQITASLLSRLAYGVSLVKSNPDSVLIVTGNGAGEIPEAVLMEKFALDMGLPKERIIVEKESMNTKDHPVYLEKILKGQPFVIVTSAYHMNRALKNFRAHGLEGIPAPTDYMNKHSDGLTYDALIMRGENLSALDRWMTEMYSTIWTQIRFLFKD